MQHNLAPIVAATSTRIQFRVDDVSPVQHPLPVSQLRTILERVLDDPLLAGSYTDDVELVDSPLKLFFAPAQVHPLLAAVHYAFSDHRPPLA